MSNLRRDSRGVREETTAGRDLVISNWHRKCLDRRCYMTDLDAVEYRFFQRGLDVRALLEYKAYHVRQERFVLTSALEVKLWIARRCEVPLLHVWYDAAPDGAISRFRIWNVSETGLITNYWDRSRELSEAEFRRLMETL